MYWNYEAAVLQIIVCWQSINVAVVVNFGSVFRAAWCRNYVLIFFLILFDSLVLGSLFDTTGSLSCIFSVNCPRKRNQLPHKFRIELFILMLGNLAALVAWEAIIVIGPVANFLRKNYHQPKRRNLKL